MKRRLTILFLLLLIAGVCFLFRARLEAALGVVGQKLAAKKTVDQRLQEYGPAARTRLRPHFDQAKAAFPPKRLVLLGIKDERRMEIHAPGADGKLRFIRSHPILATSGVAGPKLREGDGQVPEGIYGIESLNPNSSYHLSLRVSYPNAFDCEQAGREGREQLGATS